MFFLYVLLVCSSMVCFFEVEENGVGLWSVWIKGYPGGVWPPTYPHFHSLVCGVGATARLALGTPSPEESTERRTVSHEEPERLLGPRSPHYCKEGYHERDT